MIFARILSEVAAAGYLSPKAVFIDGTHIKDSSNSKKQVKEQAAYKMSHICKKAFDAGKGLSVTCKHP